MGVLLGFGYVEAWVCLLLWCLQRHIRCRCGGYVVQIGLWLASAAFPHSQASLLGSSDVDTAGHLEPEYRRLGMGCHTAKLGVHIEQLMPLWHGVSI
jgi:hypothetical protein